MTQVIKMNQISKKYADGDGFCEVLSDVNFELNQGDFALLTGNSGSGKTTFLQIASLIENASSGSYYLNGVDTANISPKEKANLLKNKIAIVYQQHNLLADFSVHENILIAMQQNTLTQSQKAFVDEVLERFGIISKKHSRLEELSGGQAQRASIARAICKGVPLLFLDEPTGNLDEETSESVMQTLNKIAVERKMSYILVTHNNNLQKYANCFFKMQKRQLIQCI